MKFEITSKLIKKYEKNHTKNMNQNFFQKDIKSKVSSNYLQSFALVGWRSDQTGSKAIT